MSVRKRKNNRGETVYYVRRMVRGKDTFRTFGAGKEGRQKAELFDSDLLAAKYEPNGNGHPKFKTFGEAAKFATDPIRMQVRGSTWAYYEFMLTQLSDWYGKLPLPQVGRGTVYEIQARLAEEGKAPKTINEYATLFSRVLALAVECGALPKNPVQGFKRLPTPDPRETIRALSPEDLTSLLKVLRRDWFRDFVVGLLNTGCRTGELRFLDWDRVLSDRLKIEPGAEYVGKTASARRVIPLLGPVREILDRNREAGTAFPFPGGNPQARTVKSTTEGRWYQAQTTAGLVGKDGKPRYRLHDLRHTYACRLAEADVNPAIAQKLLGHADIKHTLIYYKISDEQALIEGAKLGGLAG